MNEVKFDLWVKRSIQRYTNEPTWRQAVGNFGFGFIFIGALVNLLVFIAAITTKVGSEVIYHPWEPTYIVFSSLAGLYWGLRSRRQLR